MDRQYHDNLIISASPHVLSTVNTSKIMATVIVALIPAFIVAVYQFGARAAILTIVCVLASVCFEWLFNKLAKRPQTIGDCSAVVTGVILAFNLPVTIPYWMAVVGCFVAIIIVKQLFGGIGQNFANPAITARIVLLVSFATEMSTWQVPRGAGGVDAVTGATPLRLLATGEALPSYTDLFMGNVGGCIGEVSALAILIGGVILIACRVISPIIPLTYLGTVAVFTLIIGQDPVFHLLAGGLMLGAFFCATDYSTSPTLPLGKVIFGIGCGLLTVLIRVYGTYPEGVSFAILLMNILTPHIENFSVKQRIKKLNGGAAQNEQ